MSTEQMTLPGVPPLLKEQWREHTAERWLRDEPESYAECVESVKRGDINKTHLAERFKRSRNSVASLIAAEFSVEQLEGIIAKKALLVTAESLTRQDELIPEATHKELGALAMVSKAGIEASKLARGQNTQLHQHLHLHVDATAAADKLTKKAQEMGFGAGGKPALREPRPSELPVGAAADDPSAVTVLQHVEHESIRVSCHTSRHTPPTIDGDFQTRGGGGASENSCPAP